MEERLVRPPRRVIVLIDRVWQPAHLLAWRRWPSACRFLIQTMPRQGNTFPTPRWVDAVRVRPRNTTADASTGQTRAPCEE